MKWTATIEIELSDPTHGDISEKFVDAFMEGLLEHGAIDPAIYGSLAAGTVTIQLTVEAADLQSAKSLGNELFTLAQPKIPGRDIVSLIGESTHRMVPVGV